MHHAEAVNLAQVSFITLVSREQSRLFGQNKVIRNVISIHLREFFHRTLGLQNCVPTVVKEESFPGVVERFFTLVL